MATTKPGKKSVYLITIVASLGGILVGYDTAVIAGAVGALENYFIISMQDDLELSASSIFQFKVIISLCILAVGLLFGSFILKFFRKKLAYAIIGGILLLGGAIYYFQF